MLMVCWAESRAQEWTWASIAGEGQGGGYPIAVDSSGNCFVNSGSLYRSVAKFDAAGHLLWRRQGYGSSVAVDREGNLFLLGAQNWQATFGDTNQPGKFLTLTNASSLSSLFLVKFNPAGEVLWAQQSRGYDANAGTLAVDDAGHVYVSGSFWNGISLGSSYLVGRSPTNGLSVTLNGTYAPFVAKYDAGGNLVWVQKGGGALAMGRDGLLYAAGTFTGTEDYFGILGTNLTSRGSYDMFVAQYDLDGSLRWVRTTSLADATRARRLALDDSGNIFVRCQLQDSPTNALQKDYLLKFSSAGELLWTNFVHSGWDSLRGFSFDVSADGYVYATWFFSGTVSIGDRVLNARGDRSDIFVVGYNPAGELAWLKQVGDYNTERDPSLAVGPTGDIWLAGDFLDRTVIGSTALEESGWHMFLGRLNAALPSVISQPRSVRADPGGTASFSVGLTNAANPRYRWRKDETALSDNERLSGTTTSCLTISNIQTNDAGNYAVVIQADNGTVTSSPATLWFGAAARFISSYLLTNGNFMVDFTGEPGETYNIEVSTNLTFGYWTIFTNFYCPQGTFRIIDTKTESYSSRYYRAVNAR